MLLVSLGWQALYKGKFFLHGISINFTLLF